MIDFHSHIIPSLDDGSKSLQMSLDMLRTAENEGTKYICATTHYIPDDIETERKNYNEKYNDVVQIMNQNKFQIKVIPALETYIHPDLPKLYENKKIWGINDTTYILIEFPMQQFPRYSEDVFYELRLKGAKIVIAHPERNLIMMKDNSLLIKLIENGALAQVNAGSLRGIYGKDIQLFARKLVDMNLIHLVGSDAHDDRKRTTKIKDAFEDIRQRNEELFAWIIENEEKVLKGEELKPLNINYRSKKKSFWGLFK